MTRRRNTPSRLPRLTLDTTFLRTPGSGGGPGPNTTASRSQSKPPRLALDTSFLRTPWSGGDPGPSTTDFSKTPGSEGDPGPNTIASRPQPRLSRLTLENRFSGTPGSGGDSGPNLTTYTRPQPRLSRLSLNTNFSRIPVSRGNPVPNTTASRSQPINSTLNNSPTLRRSHASRRKNSAIYSLPSQKLDTVWEQGSVSPDRPAETASSPGIHGPIGEGRPDKGKGKDRDKTSTGDTTVPDAEYDEDEC